MRRKGFFLLSLLVAASMTACTINIGETIVTDQNGEVSENEVPSGTVSVVETTTPEDSSSSAVTETTSEETAEDTTSLTEEDTTQPAENVDTTEEGSTPEDSEEEDGTEDEYVSEEDAEDSDDEASDTEDAEDEDIEEEAFEDELADEETISAIPYDDYKNIKYVSSTEEFIDALVSDTLIILEPGIYDLTDYYTEVTKFKNRNVKFKEYEGITISKLKHVGIYANDGNVLTQIVEEDPECSVLIFDGCNDITISGIIFGHTEQEEYVCSGDVLEFRKTNDIFLENLNLYGCGTYGISATNVKNLTATDCWIHDCTEGILNFQNTKDATFTNCYMSFCKDFIMLNLTSNSSATFEGCVFDHNSALRFLAEKGHYTFLGCSFKNNEADEGIDDIDATFDDDCFFSEGDTAMTVG